ncbi:MAG: gliding motility-associated ABC transporter substrate-binding protein GldG [Marinilabiliales bacterium]|nr:gliding motility-associated ABC transporter substrate-binding protein GldG [Marinilabiliales bacterium]
MRSIVKKELLQFFGSLTGYMILVVFALISALFLWFFEGNMNIPEGGYASFNGFFSLAPWLYLFLIPAISMRMFSEELRSGTIELLLSRPVHLTEIILAKLLAAWLVVMGTLLLSLVGLFSVYFLGNPTGALDMAAAFGSYLGLLFMTTLFLAIGLFASSLSENQIVAFVTAILLSFFLFSGFDLLSDLMTRVWASRFLQGIGISTHYDSVSRGLLDSRDLFYFLLIAVLFVGMTLVSLNRKRKPFVLISKRNGAAAALLFLLLFLSQVRVFRIDFTAEKKYTLSAASVKVLEKVTQPMVAEIYLQGDMHPGFRKLKVAIEEELADIRQYCGNNLFVRKIDPYTEVSDKERNGYFEDLYRQGIIPTDLRIKTEKGISTRLVFPTVVIRYEGKSKVLNLLRNDPSQPAEINLNRSVEMLEYELVNAIHSLTGKEQPAVAFLDGHGEADSLQLQDISTTLSADFTVTRLKSQNLNLSDNHPRVVIIADPQLNFSESDKLMLDQYVMKGGQLVWLVDPVKVSLDSLSEGMSTLAMPRDLGIMDQLYRYGARLNSDLIQDAECMQIRVNTAPPGAAPVYSLAPWYFFPILHPSQQHPAGRNVNPLASEFVSSLDTVGEDPEVHKKVLMTTSPYSRRIVAPLSVNLRMIDMAPSRDYFNHPGFITGVMLEGRFTSVFKNRIVNQGMVAPGFRLIERSEPARVIVFSDGGLMSNKVSRSAKDPKTAPLGYDRVSRLTFGNKDFFVSLIHYCCDDAGLSGLRNKSWQLRTLDKVKLHEHLLWIKWVNLLLPVLMVILASLLFIRLRARKIRRKAAHS